MNDADGLFGPSSASWALQREAVLLLGAGPRALLLQIAHPAIAAGVAEHSDFRADPWRRLDGTLRSYLRIVYGSAPAARAEIRRLNAMHRGIRGARYNARDPELSLWVHATLIDSTLAANEAWLGPLPAGVAEAFYGESLVLGRAFGVPAEMLPADLRAFRAYMDRMVAPDGPVRVGAVARDLAAAILHPPLPGVLGTLPVPSAAYDWTLWPAVGLLPATMREGYGFRWGAREQVVSRWLVAGWRAWNPVLPAGARQMPQALAADRRVRAAGAFVPLHSGSHLWRSLHPRLCRVPTVRPNPMMIVNAVPVSARRGRNAARHTDGFEERGESPSPPNSRLRCVERDARR